MAFQFDLNKEPFSEVDVDAEHTMKSHIAVISNQPNFENLEIIQNSNDEDTNKPFEVDELEPEVGMCFNSLEDARVYYYRYARRIDFVDKKRSTNWEVENDKKVPVNQVLHCNKVGYRTSRVKAPKRRKLVSSVKCRARCYVALDIMTRK
ncbi:hypothetical protein PIB30_075859 [Stylosanthes scabra]|uniref:FAR1 domain-containing protein n=1 Tax=Stylosanthes scabra TaxID=79078 RepID=A0ABU6XS85_9FABA|nr:hypothetical protein [Stylosanthes scabra]